MYSAIIIKGPGFGTIWDGIYVTYPIRITTRTKEEHEKMIEYLESKKYVFEVIVKQDDKISHEASQELLQETTQKIAETVQENTQEKEQSQNIEQEDRKTEQVSEQEEKVLSFKDDVWLDENIFEAKPRRRRHLRRANEIAND